MSAARVRARRLALAGPAGPLECLLETVPDSRGAGIVCHPHPLFGGTMDNKVAYTLAKALQALGVTTLRFNFRGVGASAGEHDRGLGETEDVLSLADWLQQEAATDSLWLAGFSFGAWIALRAAGRLDCERLVTVAPPVQRFAVAEEPQPSCPWLIVQGAEDELVDCDAVIRWIDGMEPGPELVVMPGVDHFFHGALTELRQTIVDNLTGALHDAQPD